MNLETERIILRDFTMEDIADLQEIFGDAETMLNVEPPYDMEKTENFLRDFCIGKHGAFAACHKKDNKMIGYVLFHSLEEDVYEIGWIFNKRYWRKGYAFEICSALIKFAFTEMGAHKIIAEAIDPVKSVGLMKKLGMKLEGVQREQTKDIQGNWVDFYLCGILKEDLPCF